MRSHVTNISFLAGVIGEFIKSMVVELPKVVSPIGSFIIHRSNNLMLSIFSPVKSRYFVKRTTSLPSKCTYTTRAFRPEKVYTKTCELGISVDRYSERAGSRGANRKNLMLPV